MYVSTFGMRLEESENLIRMKRIEKESAELLLVMLLVGVRIIPIKFVMNNVGAAMSWLAPL